MCVMTRLLVPLVPLLHTHFGPFGFAIEFPNSNTLITFGSREVATLTWSSRGTGTQGRDAKLSQSHAITSNGGERWG